MTVHLSLTGQWAECSEPSCELKFHVPDITLADAQLLPKQMLEQLIEAADPPSTIYPDGVRVWQDEQGHRHRDYDLPAYRGPNIDGFSEQWLQHGEPHRGGDRPAHIQYRHDRHTIIKQSWWVNGEKHRDGDKPALIDDRAYQWYQHGERHRDGDKPAVFAHNGDKEWYSYGKRHRANGPAVIFGHNGEQWWFVHGERLTGLKLVWYRFRAALKQAKAEAQAKRGMML